jgi:hypothetical protein
MTVRAMTSDAEDRSRLSHVLPFHALYDIALGYATMRVLEVSLLAAAGGVGVHPPKRA